jgi:imidazolonepropionase-like amidohydrolase
MKLTHHIVAGRLIDGSGGPIAKNVLLTITDGVFTAIEPLTAKAMTDRAAVTDLSFATLCPPFIDCHVHLALSGSTDAETRKMQMAGPYSECRALIRRHIGYLFRHGVLAVRDAGDRDGHVRRFLFDSSVGRIEPVLIRATGRAWHKEGRYGGMFGRHPEGNAGLDAAFARETEESNQVKLINSGPNSLVEFGRETQSQFTLDEMRKVVEIAGRAGKKVMVHANGRLPVGMAIEAGCHSIEHGYFMGEENLQLMAERGVTLVPTLYAMKACAENASNAHERKIAEKNLLHQLEQLAKARELGVKVALGTDAGSPGVLHGEAVVEEMKLLMKAGYSLAETVRCATRNGADLLGIDIGLIAVGRPANFLVARGTPAQLPRKFSYLEAIYLHGKPSLMYKKHPMKVVVKKGAGE